MVMRLLAGLLVVAVLLGNTRGSNAFASSVPPTGGGIQHPNFTGEWELDRRATELQHPEIAQVLSATLIINHQDSLFSLFRTYELTNETDTLSWSLLPEGPERVSRSGDHESYDRLFWDADTLVLVSRIVAPRGVAVDTIRYVLYANGSGLEARERYCAPRFRFYNVWRYRKR